MAAAMVARQNAVLTPVQESLVLKQGKSLATHIPDQKLWKAQYILEVLMLDG